jgi:putative endonuclease
MLQRMGKHAMISYRFYQLLIMPIILQSTLKKTYWVYILLCENQSYYTGYTDNLEKRYLAHLTGKGSKYTRSFKPLKIAQSWEISGEKALAMQIERTIKKLSRKQKEALILNPLSLNINRTIQEK